MFRMVSWLPGEIWEWIYKLQRYENIDTTNRTRREKHCLKYTMEIWERIHKLQRYENIDTTNRTRRESTA